MYCTAPGVAVSSSEADRGRRGRRCRRSRRGSSGGGSGGGSFRGGCSGRYNSPLVVRERQGVKGLQSAVLDVNRKGALLSVGAG